jgi:hypothetical protein
MTGVSRKDEKLRKKPKRLGRGPDRQRDMDVDTDEDSDEEDEELALIDIRAHNPSRHLLGRI